MYIYIFFFTKLHKWISRWPTKTKNVGCDTRSLARSRSSVLVVGCSRNSSPIRRPRECAIPCEMKRMHFHPASRFATFFHSRKPPLVLLDPSNSLENVRHFDYDSSSLKPRRLTVSLRNQRKGEEKESDRGRKVRKWRKVRERNRILHTKLLIRCCTFFIFFLFFSKVFKQR